MSKPVSNINQAPQTLPVWQVIKDDLGNPPAHRLSRVLGVGIRTIYRWNRTGHAPRCACLALFWLTRWGRSQVHCQAVNDAALSSQYADALLARNQVLTAQLARLGHEPWTALPSAAERDGPVTRPVCLTGETEAANSVKSDRFGKRIGSPS